MAQTTSNPNAHTGPEKRDSLSLPTKTATLQFFDDSDPKWATEKPFYSNIPFTQTKIANTNVINTSARVQISDARGHESEFTLDKNGFQLVKWKHQFSDVGPSFQEEGYPAVVKFMKDVLGSHVKVRQSQPRGSAPGEENGYIGRPSKVAHNGTPDPLVRFTKLMRQIKPTKEQSRRSNTTSAPKHHRFSLNASG
ncbi:hypothetical protein BFJ69_g10215 [Fusarium oxysporum]|uniref:Uncharacterized protein n=1 Tax=Fusarium oxysporum TaxID=5507 RepID=A0A420MWA0_FUSOX|nr:hypothetical protein BFJ69_g10215 [Fusarium oxysporum]